MNFVGMKALPQQPVIHTTILTQLTNSMCYATSCNRLIALNSDVVGLVQGHISDSRGPIRK